MSKAALLIIVKNWKWKQFTLPSVENNRCVVIHAYSGSLFGNERELGLHAAPDTQDMISPIQSLQTDFGNCSRVPVE